MQTSSRLLVSMLAVVVTALGASVLAGEDRDTRRFRRMC